LAVTSLITFVRSSLAPSEVAKALQATKIRESTLPAEQVWYGDFESK
jgi:hypothetical protein